MKGARQIQGHYFKYGGAEDWNKAVSLETLA